MTMKIHFKLYYFIGFHCCRKGSQKSITFYYRSLQVWKCFWVILCMFASFLCRLRNLGIHRYIHINSFFPEKVFSRYTVYRTWVSLKLKIREFYNLSLFFNNIIFREMKTFAYNFKNWSFFKYQAIFQKCISTEGSRIFWVLKSV